jgi:hypothetical protein
MKYNILCFCFVLCANNYAHVNKGILPPYSIQKDEVDASLKKTESVFVFTFLQWGEGSPYTGKIKAAGNGKNVTIETNDQGQFIYRPVPGKYIFQFYLNDNYEEVYTDSIEIKPGHRIEMNVNFLSSQIPVIMDKPVIYLYPQKTTPVHIQLDLKGELGFTYPPYNHGWTLTADPNGMLHMNNQDYKYLFWEGATHIPTAEINWSEGYLVEKKDLLFFLENTLTQMGLSGTEQQDYITYWYPGMSQYETTYIHFMFNQTYDAYAHLTVTPQPDQVFRVYMLWQNAGEIKNFAPTPQQIPTLKREGFTLVEWGGSELKNLTPLSNL